MLFGNLPMFFALSSITINVPNNITQRKILIEFFIVNLKINNNSKIVKNLSNLIFIPAVTNPTIRISSKNSNNIFIHILIFLKIIDTYACIICKNLKTNLIYIF